MKLIEDIKEKFGDNLLYIGLRGSRCLGLETAKSDYDLTIVLKEDLNYSSMNNLENNHIMNKSTFIKTVIEFSFNLTGKKSLASINSVMNCFIVF